MAFDDVTQNLIKNVDETLKLLHETIQKQTIATDKQSKVIVRLTRFLLAFTIALFIVGLFQVAIFMQDRDTTTHNPQAQTHREQIPTDGKLSQSGKALPPVPEGGNEGKHK